MSKRVINGLLLVFTLSLWAGLGYTYFKSQNGGVPTVMISADNTAPLPNLKKDTVVLQAHYRDPFLGKLVMVKKQATNTVKTASVKQAVQKTPSRTEIFWPNVTYLGFIKDKEGKSPLIMLRINQQLYRKKIGELVAEGISIHKFYKDSIQLDFNGQKIMIKK